MKSILLIIPYFGKWPVWFDAHLLSIKTNPTINWLIPTDCEIPKEYPKNIKFIATSLQEIKERFNVKLGFDIELDYRKFCDLKPTYGKVFEEELEAYDFWGFCDMDIIWGDIRKYITDEILTQYDIISSRKKAISGHFNLFKNNSKNRYLYKEVPNYQYLLSTNLLTRFDENLLTDAINKKSYFKVYWSKILCNQERGFDSRQEYYLNKWLYKNGKIYDLKGENDKEEYMYMHFMNWKKKMKRSHSICLNTNSFYISYNSIHLNKYSTLKEVLNNIKNNMGFGYWNILYRKSISVKINKFIKKIHAKISK